MVQFDSDPTGFLTYELAPVGPRLDVACGSSVFSFSVAVAGAMSCGGEPSLAFLWPTPLS